jgi:hypothetical protein
MSLKKEMLSTLTQDQLQRLADSKGIAFNSLNTTQKQYYAEWNDKDRLVDLMATNGKLTIRDIEQFIHTR